MKDLFSTFLVGVALLAVTACVAREKAEAPASVSDKPDVSALPDDLALGKYVDVDGARIYALIDSEAPESTIYITLDEAMAAKVCTIREVGASTLEEPEPELPEPEPEDPAPEDAEPDEQQVILEDVTGDVNTLIITNTGDKPIFLMAGDLVLGGKQDRILGESVVVEANTKDQPIPVFCVEHGRWTPQRKDGTAAMTGYFTNSKEIGQVDVSVKKAALGSNQQGQVWESVSKSNEGLGVDGETASGTFRAAFDSKEVKAKIDGSYSKAKTLVGDGVVGFAVYVDGEPVAMDAFDSVELCSKLSEKLLRSYIVSGMNGGYEETQQPEFEAIGGVVFGSEDNVGGQQVSEPPVNSPSPPEPEAPNEDLAEPLDDSDSENEQSIVTLNGRFVGSRTTELNTASSTNDQSSRTASPNARTANRSDVTKKAIKYTCKDKKTGKSIQRSFMRR